MTEWLLVTPVLDAASRDPSWAREVSEERLIGADGGSVAAGNAKLSIDRDLLQTTHSVKIEHQQPAEGQQLDDALVRIEGEEVQIGDRVTVSIRAQSLNDATVTGDHGDKGAERVSTVSTGVTATVDFPVVPPASKPNPDLYASSTVEDEQPSQFERVTESAGLKLVKKALGATHLTFNTATSIATRTATTVYDVVWSSSKFAASKISSAVGQYLSDGESAPLHVRLHYLCDDRGYPCRLLTVIAAGPPPQPEAGSECHDGLYSARCDGGGHNLKKKTISSRDHLRVRIKPLNPTSAWKMESTEYTFSKPPQTIDSHYHYLGMGLDCENFSRSCCARQKLWEVLIEVEKNGKPIGNGNTVLTIQRQVGNLIR